MQYRTRTSLGLLPMTLALLLLAIWLLPHAATAQSDVISCGGFVSVSAQMQAALKEVGVDSVDLSSVQVQLLSPQGVKNSEGDCSPNGYYFVPVEAGTYKVRVRAQPGWVFKPQEVQISCSSQSCNGGDDVNFELTGFELSGHVEAAPAAASCKAAPAAYSGISIAVRPADSSAKATAAAATAQVSDSSFTTGPLLPGKYVITAAHPDWTLAPAQITHTLGPDSAQLPKPFVVTGYTLSGSVTSRSGPVAGVQVTLLSSDVEAAGCSATHPPGHVEAVDLESALSTTALCSVLSGQDGRYSFPGVPCGRYTLQATHPDTDSRFEIEPSSQEVVVGHSNAAALEPFTVAEFSVQGRVVDGSGDGVAGVEIRVGRELKATTDLNGRYSLARMSEGRVDITATKKHHSFSSLSTVHVTPSAALLPDITVTSLALCGRLEHGEQRFKGSTRRVSLVSNDGAGVTQQTTADATSGAFCFASVPPGRYKVAPYISADDKAKGLVFSPGHVDLQLAGQPLVNVVFSQAQLSLAGEVVCLAGPCPGDVQLVLRAADGKVATSVRLDEVAVKGKQSTGSSIRYVLPKVSPGRYMLVASRAGWCWQAEQGVEVVVESSDVEAAPLQQAGYQLQVTASHPATLTLSGTSQQYTAAPGSTTDICIPTTGQLQLTASSCFVFGPERGSYTIVVDPEQPLEPLVLQAERVDVSGEVVIAAGSSAESADSADSSSANSLPQEISVTVTLSGQSKDAAQVVKAIARNPAKPRVYTYGLTVDLGASVVLTPSVGESNNLLPYPRSRVYKLDASSKECPPAIPTFEAKRGRMLAGVLEPAVEGAEVMAFFQSTSTAAGSSAGDVAAQATTDASGSFRLGPLYSDAEYTVQLSKSGHIITPPSISPAAAGSADGTEQQQLLRFVSKHLASVAVSVDLPAGTRPSAVYLSLSGSGGFKSNARLGPDSSLTFQDLQPGMYYLKPLLREHQFEPPVADLALEDGQAATVTLTAVRNAWGISGAVASVVGNPLAGAVVEACQGSGAAAVVLDSSITDHAGEYHIGNLKPSAAYEMRVRLDGRVISAHPASQQVDLQRADVTGIDFIAFRTSSRSTLSAALKLPSELRSAIKAELMPAGGSSSSSSSSKPSAAGATVLAAVAVDGSGFFEMRGLKPGAYVLRLSCDPAAAGGMSCEPWELPVQVPAKGIHLGVLPYKAAPLASSTSAAGMQLSDEGLDWKAPVMVLLLLAAGSVTVFKPTIIDILQLRAAVSAPANGSGSVNAGAAAASGQGNSSRAAAAAAAAASRAAAVAAAAAAPLPAGNGGSVAAAAAGAKDDSDWLDDNEMRGMGMKQRGAAGARSRARRA